MRGREADLGPPVWPVLADLMACVAGLLVLLFLWAAAAQTDLAFKLETERALRTELEKEKHAEEARLATLEKALAAPLADGRIVLDDGRIGIRGSVLFELGSAELSDEGRLLVSDLAPALKTFVHDAELLLMVSGFTDDLPVKEGASYLDNWELSAQRALTVTRAMIEAGLPQGYVVAAGFGENHPVADNASEEGRAKNRRVEIAPVPRKKKADIAQRAAGPLKGRGEP